jgi:hypothetical protein
MNSYNWVAKECEIKGKNKAQNQRYSRSTIHVKSWAFLFFLFLFFMEANGQMACMVKEHYRITVST